MNNILNKVKNNILLTESGIKMPVGTKSAKVITHEDVDGVFSAILTIAQLVKQGIPKERITIEFAQYGDDKDDLYNKLLGKKNQMVSVVDFAALPTGNAYESLNMVMNYKMNKNQFIDFIKKNQKDFSTMGEAEFKKLFLDTFELKEEDLKDKAKKNISDAHKALKHFNFDKVKDLTLGSGNLETYFATKLKNPDFGSDHHDNSKGDLTAGKAGKIGATEYKSDAEHISTVYAQNLADYSTIKYISMIDSAGYTDIENTIFMNKDFRNKGRMERLAAIINSLVPQLISKNPAAAKEVIRSSEPSMTSIYNNTLKAMKFHDTQLKMYEEMKKETPDWSLITSMSKTLPKAMAKDYTNKEKYKGMYPLKSIEDWRKKGEEDIAKALTGYWSPNMEDLYQKTKIEGKAQEKALKDFIFKSDEERKTLGRANKAEPKDIADKRLALKALIEDKTKELQDLQAANKEKLSPMEKERETRKGQFERVGAVMRQDATSTRDYPSRYMSSLMERDGVKSPFILKRFGTMIQVALNPYAPKEVKETVDLGELSKKILDELEEDFKKNGAYNTWFMKVVRKESGGHKGITNVSGLGTIGLMSSADRERYNDLVDIKQRVAKVGKKFNEMMPNKKEELDKLQAKKDEAAKTRAQAMDFIEKRFYEILWKKYSGVKIPGSGKYELPKPVSFEKK